MARGLTNMNLTDLEANPGNLLDQITELMRRLDRLERASSLGLMDGEILTPPKGLKIASGDMNVAASKRFRTSGWLSIGDWQYQEINASSEIFVDGSYVRVETNGGAALSNLLYIIGGQEGDLLFLRPYDDTHTVRVARGGNLLVQNPAWDLVTKNDMAVFFCTLDGSGNQLWLEVALTQNVS